MRILIDIGHPAHVHLFRNFAKEMIKRGHKVLFTCRDREFVLYLLQYYGFGYRNFGKHYETLQGKAFGIVKNILQMLDVSLVFKPDIYLSHGSTIAGFASFVIDNIEEQSMYNIVHHSFNSFFDEFILPYPESKSYPINFVGSIAALLSDILKDIGSKRNLFVNNIVRYPIDALVDYHLNKF